jgi:osmotically-inducible protein OsmY
VGSDRGYDPYGAAYGGVGEAVDRDRRYGADPRDQRQYDSREASGAMLHQGYRAPFDGVRGDAQGYSNPGYGQGAYADTNRSQYNNYRVDGNRDGAGVGARDFAAHDDRDFWSQTRDEVSSWFGDDKAAHRRELDDARGSLHRGRGPKGYTRSDDRIREDVNDRLTDDHLLDASDIEAKVSNGEVTLSGHVESRQAKRRAEDIADRIAGVKHVQNNLRVHDHQTTSSFAASNGTSAASGQTASGQTGSGQIGSGQTATKSN